MSPPVRPIKDRIHDSVNITDTGFDTPCWLWKKSLIWSGYAKTWYQGKTVAAHRLSYEVFIGPIPDGLQVDHLCKIKHCVNPEHLEPVTPRTNVMRADTVAARNAAKTHCGEGHEYAGDNLLIVQTTGERRCRTCTNETARQYRNRQRGKL